ncbi:MAG TPA: methyltransferase domain-containing protein, partial [Acidimicrobiales bacterium]|nr:methyltransferase domain-containing protein [Acidimicrobiales bacterium]
AIESLEAVNRRIHDGVPLDQLLQRGRSYCDRLFDPFPEAAPKPGDSVLELGSGVGWVMEAMLERFAIEEIVGLDISSNMISRAQERLSDARARFVLYDGLHIPFPNDHYPVIYSVAAIQHIEKHAAFLLFEELFRVLRPGGHGLIHLLSVDHIPGAVPTYHDECWNHVLNRPVHWHHYYAFDELMVLFSDVIGATDLDIIHDPSSHAFVVHFSKGTGCPFRRPEIVRQRFTNHQSAAAPSGLPQARGWRPLLREALALLPASAQRAVRRLPATRALRGRPPT